MGGGAGSGIEVEQRTPDGTVYCFEHDRRCDNGGGGGQARNPPHQPKLGDMYVSISIIKIDNLSF
jgi:hypothetical protein